MHYLCDDVLRMVSLHFLCTKSQRSSSATKVNLMTKQVAQCMWYTICNNYQHLSHFYHYLGLENFPEIVSFVEHYFLFLYAYVGHWHNVSMCCFYSDAVSKFVTVYKSFVTQM